MASPELRREIHGGLQVVGNWNSGNTVIFGGKDGDLTGPDRQHAEVPCWRCACCNPRWCINTLLLQGVLEVRSSTTASALTNAARPGRLIFHRHTRPARAVSIRPPQPPAPVPDGQVRIRF